MAGRHAFFRALPAGLLAASLAAFSTHAFAGASDTAGDPFGEAGSPELRVLQYEAVLGDPLDARNGACVDDAMGHRLDIPMGDDGSAQRAADEVRAAAEQCSLAQGGDHLRLVGGVRKALADQMFLRASSLAGARSCLDKAPSLNALRDCVTAAIGVPPSAAEWPRWTALYAQRAQR
ncbi:MAG TPA: hypothetical protein VHV99_19075 [Paraburkholderia sp.]|jgi:hypothetical protein|nr:hypothetical protein [Paraburkholderia sp.]